MHLQLLRRPLVSVLSALVFAPATASALPILPIAAPAQAEVTAPSTAPASPSPRLCDAGPAAMPLSKLHAYHQTMPFWPDQQQVAWRQPSVALTASDTCTA